MIIVKKSRHDRFATITKDILELNTLSWKAKGLLTWITSHSEGYQLHKETIIKNFSLEGRRSITAGFDELIVFGYMKKHQPHLNGHLRSVHYLASQEPLNDAEWQGLIAETDWFDVEGIPPENSGVQRAIAKRVTTLRATTKCTTKKYNNKINNNNNNINSQNSSFQTPQMSQQKKQTNAMILNAQKVSEIQKEQELIPSKKDVLNYFTAHQDLGTFQDNQKTKLAQSFYEYNDSMGWRKGYAGHEKPVYNWQALVTPWLDQQAKVGFKALAS